MDIVSNSFEKMKNDFVKRKSEEEEEEENLNFEIQTDNLTARFKLDKQQLNCSEEEKNDIDTRKSVLEMETNPVKARFNLGKDLNCSEKQEKNDIDTKKYEDLNCSEKRSSVMEEEEEEEERIEDEEYVCHFCGLRGNKFLGYFSCCNQLVAHRYCVLKEMKDKSLEARVRSVEPYQFFTELEETGTSLIDHLVRKFGRNSSD